MITWLPHGTHVIVFKNLEQAGAISFSNFLCGNFFTRVIFDHIVRGIPELSIFGIEGCCDDMTGFCMVVSVAASTFTIGTSENSSKSCFEND